MGKFGPVKTLEATGRGRMRSIPYASEFASVKAVDTNLGCLLMQKKTKKHNTITYLPTTACIYTDRPLQVPVTPFVSLYAFVCVPIHTATFSFMRINMRKGNFALNFKGVELSLTPTTQLLEINSIKLGCPIVIV